MYDQYLSQNQVPPPLLQSSSTQTQTPPPPSVVESTSSAQLPPMQVVTGGTNNVGTPTTPPSINTTPTQQSYTYNPTIRSVDPNETVQGQFTGLMAQDNPIVQMARTGAKQQMNAKGLLNSSMAIGAADAAGYQAMLPIAQNDAQIYGQANRDNQGYLNESLKYGASAQNEASKTNTAAWVDIAGKNLDAATKTGLADIEAEYKTTMQSSASASELYKQAVKNMSDIMANPDLNVAAKNNAINNQIFLLRSGMQISGAIGNLNLGGLLDFSGTPMA